MKFIDPDKHRDYTGVSNELILSNLQALVESGRPVIIRLPLIPGANDSQEQVRQLAGLAWALGLRRIDLLPYHRIGIDKYRRLGITCRVGGLEPAPDANLDRIAAELRQRGFTVSIGG